VRTVFHTARLDSAPKASQHLSLFHLQTIELSDLLSDVTWHVTHSKDDSHPHRTGSRLMPSVAPVCIQEALLCCMHGLSFAVLMPAAHLYRHIPTGAECCNVAPAALA